LLGRYLIQNLALTSEEFLGDFEEFVKEVPLLMPKFSDPDLDRHPDEHRL
jgi:hypothetical protein